MGWRARGAFPAAALVVGLALVGCGSDSSESGVSILFNKPATAVERLVVTSQEGRKVELTSRDDGFWAPGEGTPPVTAALLFEAQDEIFPLRAYRAISADTETEEFGLAPPALRLVAEDSDGERHTVLFGSATFNQAGYYARSLGDDEAVYLVPRRVVHVLTSMLEGRVIDFEHPVDERLAKVAEEAERSPADKPHAWLVQALERGPAAPQGAR